MKILVIAPHRDDELLGVGGTLLKRKAQGDQVTVCIVTAAISPGGDEEIRILEEEMGKAHRHCGIDKAVRLPFESVILETYPRADLNQALLDVILEEKPEEVYIPFWGDIQVDHRVTTDAAMVVLRAKYNHPVKRIYAYETLSETGINLPNAENTFIPNVFVDISDYLEDKIKALDYYQSQMHPFPDLRSLEAVEALARLRGATVNVKAAEAFMLVREIK